MPFRPTDDGSMVPVRAVNRPAQGGPPATHGAAVSAAARGTGVGNLSTAARAALAVGAHSGSRAARFAVEAVRSRGLAGMGWTFDHVDSRGLQVDAYGNTFAEDQAATLQFEVTQAAQPDQPETQGLFQTLFGQPQSNQGILSQISGQGITAYRQFTGQGPAAPRPVPTTGPSAGVILGVLLGVAVVGTGIAVVASRKPSVRANRPRRVRHHRARRNHYFVMKRAA